MLIVDGFDRTFVTHGLEQNESMTKRHLAVIYLVTVDARDGRGTQHTESIGTQDTLRRSIARGVLLHILQAIDKFTDGIRACAIRSLRRDSFT